MRGVFLYDRAIDSRKPTGVDKKVLNQIKAFNEAGLNCSLYPLEKNERSKGKIDLILRRIPWGNVDPAWTYHDTFDTVDYIYFRKPSYLTVHLRQTLKKIKQRNKNVKIVMEIPTYPYDNEYSGMKDLPFLLKDRYNRRLLHGCIDHIFFIADQGHASLFGIPASRIINGIDLSIIPIRIPIIDDVIDICAVAKFSQWHGYERLLLGMKKYYATGGHREFKLHMVGDGPELPYYKNMSEDPLIRDRVIFYGSLHGKALEDIYDQADLGACSLGFYKSGAQVSSILKSREYLAKGLPMITGCTTDILDEHVSDFYIEYPNDSSPLDFTKILSFYDAKYQNMHTVKRLALDMRSYAEERVAIGITMQPIIKYILSA